MQARVPGPLVGAALLLVTVVIVIAILVMVGPRDGVIWADHGEPCHSPSSGPPGGCLLPPGYAPSP